MSELVRLDELFDIRRGVGPSQAGLEHGRAAYIGAAGKNNGLVGFYDCPTDGNAGELTIGATGVGGVCCAFVQPAPFTASQNVYVLKPKKAMSVETKLYYSECITANKSRFCYGRILDQNRVASLLVPAEVPDWVQGFDVDRGLDPKTDRLPFTTEVLASLPAPNQWAKYGFDQFFVESEPASLQQVTLPDPSDWKVFRLDELFEISRGTTVTMKALELGDVPVVSASVSTNSISGRYDVTPNGTAGDITLTVNGAVGYATVQDEPFMANGDVVILKPHDGVMGLSAKMFMCGLIREVTRETFGYGRKLNGERLNGLTIKLPVTAAGDPDWGLIEAYMATLKWSKVLDEKKEG